MSFLQKNKNNMLGLILFFVLFTFVILSQYKYDKIVHPTIIFKTETKYVMPSSIVKNFSFGFKNVLADFYWISIIQDFSIWDGRDTFYLREYENVSTLDPSFAYPYLLGILTFTSKGMEPKGGKKESIEAIEPIIAIGMKNLPNNWEIPFYMGTGFQLLKLPEKALPYLKIAASKQDTPDVVIKVYNSYLKNLLTGDNATKALIGTIYETTNSETTKKILKEGVIINNLKEVLEIIIKNYKIKYGYYPSTLNDLVNTGMIKNTQALSDEFNVSINNTTGEVKITSKEK